MCVYVGERVEEEGGIFVGVFIYTVSGFEGLKRGRKVKGQAMRDNNKAKRQERRFVCVFLID